jgi:hypothetical protein
MSNMSISGLNVKPTQQTQAKPPQVPATGGNSQSLSDSYSQVAQAAFKKKK